MKHVLLINGYNTPGPNCFRIGAHSFRINAATSAAMAHIPDSQIKMLGRRQSNTYHPKNASTRIGQSIQAFSYPVLNLVHVIIHIKCTLY